MRFKLTRRMLLASAVAAGASASLGDARQAAAQGLLGKVQSGKKLVIGIHNRSPWGFKDPNSDAVTGWHPDLLRLVFSDLGVEIDFRVTEFGALIPGLMAKRFDAIASGLAITPERCTQVAFGAPDLRVPDAGIVLAGNPKQIFGYADIAAKGDVIMGAGRGSVVAKHAEAAGVPADRMLLFPDIDSNMSALRAGRIDVVILTSPTVIGLLSAKSAEGLERASPFATDAGADNYAAIAFRKEDADLRDLYDERLAKAKADGAVGTLMTKYGFGDAERTPADLTTAALCTAKEN